MNLSHLAIIADGNRRWAKARSKPSIYGHTKGLETIEEICEWATYKHLEMITIYCFSTENWGREKSEIEALFNLGAHYFKTKLWWYIEHNIRIVFAGRRDRFSDSFLEMMESIEDSTRICNGLMFNVCIDYGGRDEIVRAFAAGAQTEEDVNDIVLPPPNMILRTGGQHRLSNFMLWQAAYSELYFIDTLFPALSIEELDAAVEWFEKQKQNFGK